ncbi:hypothetical protein TNCV_1901101 [Trichonephila clavipes]|nr:hypothetical protein TNCV_1901101 [Trichonephila clavipes]
MAESLGLAYTCRKAFVRMNFDNNKVWRGGIMWQFYGLDVVTFKTTTPFVMLRGPPQINMMTIGGTDWTSLSRIQS